MTTTETETLTNPANPHLGDPNGSTYSVQIYIEIEEEEGTEGKQITFLVDWDQSADNWVGTPADDVTYSLDSSKNMMDYTMDGYDPDHTNQDDSE